MYVKGANIVFQVNYTSNSKLRKKILDLWLPETGVDRESENRSFYPVTDTKGTCPKGAYKMGTTKEQ